MGDELSVTVRGANPADGYRLYNCESKASAGRPFAGQLVAKLTVSVGTPSLAYGPSTANSSASKAAA
jgi:hypothetical protein